MTVSRRVFLARSATALAATSVGYAASAQSDAAAPAKNDRPSFALIGAGYQPATKRQGRGIAVGKAAAKLGDIAMICELDQQAADFAAQRVGNGAAQMVDDYRRCLDNKNIDAVLIATPDHWHAKIAIEAMAAGKDVYCEKPVATTIEEGKLIRDAAKKTGRVFQVGTQQRSEYNQRFLTAIALVRSGRLGKVNQITVGLGTGNQGGPFETTQPPATLQWNKWLGPAPWTEYIAARTHRTFRWWFEYAGGQICDWGAHHVDIAQWAIGQQHAGPMLVSAKATMNQPLKNGMPTLSNHYNTPLDFDVTCRFPNDVQLTIDSSRNGITFTGDKGRIFVNRGTLAGVAVDQLKDHPLPPAAVSQLYDGKLTGSHMQNFVDCMRLRTTPISDIASHHRNLTTCHLANIAIRLNRDIKWDSQTEQIIGDEQAQALQQRANRPEFEIEGV